MKRKPRIGDQVAHKDGRTGEIRRINKRSKRVDGWNFYVLWSDGQEGAWGEGSWIWFSDLKSVTPKRAVE